MSITTKMLAALTTLTIVVGGGTVGTIPANAATPECGPDCISVFSHALGTYGEPNFVETVLNGVARVGQPVILSQASGSDPSQDLKPNLRPVSAFYAEGMVSARVNRHYGTFFATQIRYSPLGQASDLCVGLDDVAYQNEGLTLQPCTVPATTVWIVDPLQYSPDDGVFALVNGSTRFFSHPLAMTFPRHADPTDPLESQIRVRRLQFRGHDHAVPLWQLWGALMGPLSG
jgi:hypothetical protein